MPGPVQLHLQAGQLIVEQQQRAAGLVLDVPELDADPLGAALVLLSAAQKILPGLQQRVHPGRYLPGLLELQRTGRVVVWCQSRTGRKVIPMWGNPTDVFSVELLEFNSCFRLECS